MTGEAKSEAFTLLVFKEVCDVEEVENFLWHLENYSQHENVRDGDAKINTVVFYLLKIVMLW